jgi:histidinol-phosphate aminotransferase
MPRFRSDIAAIRPYAPGRSIEEVAAEIGLPPGDIVKLASNESPEGPFPGVVEAVARVLAGSNRYPDNDNRELTAALSAFLDVPSDHLWFGSGSVSLLSDIALAVGGPGTSSVYSWPSFVMYRIASGWAMSEPIEVPLVDHTQDPDAIAGAIRDDTTIVYLCNPNNPTGVIVSSDAVARLVDAIPESVLLVIDEAYHDYVTDDTYSTSIPLALRRNNVVVLRTFSKIFALASHRVGYAVAAPATIAEMRKAQAPFGVTETGQAAAVASLGDPAELERRARSNATARHLMHEALVERSLTHSDSQANFVYFELGLPASESSTRLTRSGVIVRPMSGGWLRVTIGTEAENRHFVAALDELLGGI